MSKKKLLIVIAGATAVGKTALCVGLAQKLHAQVVSADSRQLFKEMSIGTAKPNPSEMQDVIHHLIDSHSIHGSYDVRQYEQEALQVLENIFKKDDIVILTGGSGLYIDAVCEGLNEMPEIDPAIKVRLQKTFDEQGLEPLLKQLQLLDNQYFNEVDKANHRRVLRALEVCLSSGKPFSSFRNQPKANRPFDCLKILLVREREELYNRINKRVDMMLEQGLFDEAKNLYPFKHQRALQTVGYQEIFDFLDKKYDWEECLRLLKRNSRRYAKRQGTWFGKDSRYHHFYPDDGDKILAFLQEELKNY